jgi:hypothetical protein
MKNRSAKMLLLMIGCTISIAKAQSIQKKIPSLQTVKNKISQYVKDALPKTKKDVALTIISEGIADGIFFYLGFQNLVFYYRNNPKDFVNFMRITQDIDITEVPLEKVDKNVQIGVNDVMTNVGLKKPACVHYATGMEGAFCHGRDQLFLSPEITKSSSEEEAGKSHSIQELQFATAHELGHAYSKDALRRGIFALATPIIAYAAVKAYDALTSKLIDLLITKMKLDPDSQAYKILQRIKTVHSTVATSPIVRLIIAFSIWLAYYRYTEKQADLFAAKHGYAEGGISTMERLQKHGYSDSYHPSPEQRAKYLRKAAEQQK